MHRSDESGTTKNFTDYLAQAASERLDRTRPSKTWPIQGGEAANGTSGVVAAVTAATGTIGYADASQAGRLGKALIKVGQLVVAPSAEAASKVLDESTRRTRLARRPTSPSTSTARPRAAGAYPIMLISYLIACPTQTSADAADLVKGFLTYVVQRGGPAGRRLNAGSAPLPVHCREGQAAIDTITAK